VDRLDPDPERQRRRRLVAQRCIDAGRAWMQATYGSVDYGEEEWRARLGSAISSAARELARTGALADLGIDAPAQISKLTCELVMSDELSLVESYSYSFSFDGTDLADVAPEAVLPPLVDDGTPGST